VGAGTGDDMIPIPVPSSGSILKRMQQCDVTLAADDLDEIEKHCKQPSECW
jgi:hypothetical protein